MHTEHRTWTTIAGAADHIGVHEHTIRRWIAAGRLPAHRVGPRLIRIRLSDLDAMAMSGIA